MSMQYQMMNVTSVITATWRQKLTKDYKITLTLSIDDIRYYLESQTLTENQIERVFKTLSANNVIIDSFWELLKQIIDEVKNNDKV